MALNTTRRFPISIIIMLIASDINLKIIRVNTHESVWSTQVYWNWENDCHIWKLFNVSKQWSDYKECWHRPQKLVKEKSFSTKLFGWPQSWLNWSKFFLDEKWSWVWQKCSRNLIFNTDQKTSELSTVFSKQKSYNIKTYNKSLFST